MAENPDFEFPGRNIKWGQNAGGVDLSGTYPNNISVSSLTGITLSSGNILGNNTASSGPPTNVSLTSIIDRAIGSTQNDILQRDASNWVQVTVSSAIDNGIGSTQGDILYRNASNWVVLAPGTSGQVLTTGGAGANPSWITQVINTVDSNFTVSSNQLQLHTIAAGNILANSTSSTAEPTSTTLTATIDQAIGATQGQILYRSGSAWSALAVGTSGNVLMTKGSSANPAWSKVILTDPGTACTITVANNKTFTVNNTITLSGTDSTTWTGPTTSATLLSTAGATAQLAHTDPSGTTSTTGVMMGLGNTFTLTPVNSTRVLVCIAAAALNNTANDGALFSLRYGTGTAPTNGAALTGTLVGQTGGFTGQPAPVSNPFYSGAPVLVTGLSTGTAYWFDLALKALTGGTASIQAPIFFATEI